MRSEAARVGESIVGGEILYMVLELSDRRWKVLFRSGSGRQRERSVPAREVARLIEEIAAAKRRLGLKPAARVVSCYEIAWCWLRFQPQSGLSLWWRRRFGTGSGRTRKVAIVALARKLLVALWRYLEQGIVPEGASLKTPKAAAGAGMRMA